MTPGPQGSLRLFRLFGIDVYVHWAWAFVAIYQIQYRAHEYSSIAWGIAEYLTLFLIVLVHEFGHALATRQVGGSAEQILLWPFGGVAYVSPPPRPGAELWSIAAGPLVNVVLFFVLSFVVATNHIPLWIDIPLPDTSNFLRSIWWMNSLLLMFNMLPVYPLDGGQILRALLWFVLGRARSMYVAAVVGFIGVAGLAMYALNEHSIWLGLITFYIFQNCRRGWAHAKALTAMEQQPRRTDFACPSCHMSPPIGALWRCPQCETAFDTFETQAVCPNCHLEFPATRCLNCHVSSPILNWRTPVR
ncbi:MAG: M50 family metallopeptidase [Chthoniobacter sp.]|uniref:M50 family metallopeptidase n=1 Tax=Chthoniobacter sp. TaxID=2510640 RepID=UPI0032A6E066